MPTDLQGAVLSGVSYSRSSQVRSLVLPRLLFIEWTAGCNRPESHRCTSFMHDGLLVQGVRQSRADKWQVFPERARLWFDCPMPVTEQPCWPTGCSARANNPENKAGLHSTVLPAVCNKQMVRERGQVGRSMDCWRTPLHSRVQGIVDDSQVYRVSMEISLRHYTGLETSSSYLPVGGGLPNLMGSFHALHIESAGSR